MTKRPRDAGNDVADAYRCVCMREPTQEQHATFPAALTPLDRQVYALRQQLPSSVILLVVCGYKVKLYGRDSRVASRRFGIVCVKTVPFESSSFPVVRLPHYLTRLSEMGYHVALADQVETAAIRASGTKTGTKVFERKITAMYSRATTSSATFESLYQSSASSAHQQPADDDGGADDEPEGEQVHNAEGAMSSSSAAAEGAPGSIHRRLQEASLRWILALTVSTVDGTQHWSIRLISLLSLVQSSVEVVRGNEAALVQLRDVFLKCDPCEIICDRTSASLVLTHLEELGECPLHQGPTVEGTEDSCRRTFISDFQSDKIERLGTEYAERFQASLALESIRTLPLQEIISGHDVRSMYLPATACNALGLFPQARNRQGYSSSMLSLVELLDRCTTKVGSRMLRRWVSAPLCEKATIHSRQEAVRAIAGADVALRALFDAVIDAVKGYLSDPEATLSRLTTGQASVSEVVSLVKVMTKLQQLRIQSPSPSSFVNDLMREANGGEVVEQLLQFLMQRMNLGARDCATVFEGVKALPPSIVDIHKDITQANAMLDAALVDIRAVLKSPQHQFSTVAGTEYLVDVVSSKVAKGVTIPTDWTVISRTKTNVRYHPADVVQATTSLFAARDRLQIAAEGEWRVLLLHTAETYASSIVAARGMLRAAGTLDALVSFSMALSQPGYILPEVTDNKLAGVSIQAGRHPMLDVALGGSAVAVDIVVPPHGTWILTGPNMGGKSALLRTAGLFAVMAQIGAPVPARCCAMPVFDALYCRMGSEDSILEHRSTFLNEMIETGDILRSSYLNNALVLVDELGQGTSSFDGLAVATATLHHLTCSGATTMFVTHHTVICDEYQVQQNSSEGRKDASANENARVVCKYMSFEYQQHSTETTTRSQRNDVKFLHVPVDGVSPSSFGIHVASMANLPASVITLAEERSRDAESKQRQRIQLHGLAAFVGLV